MRDKKLVIEGFNENSEINEIIGKEKTFLSIKIVPLIGKLLTTSHLIKLVKWYDLRTTPDITLKKSWVKWVKNFFPIPFQVLVADPFASFETGRINYSPSYDFSISRAMGIFFSLEFFSEWDCKINAITDRRYFCKCSLIKTLDGKSIFIFG